MRGDLIDVLNVKIAFLESELEVRKFNPGFPSRPRELDNYTISLSEAFDAGYLDGWLGRTCILNAEYYLKGYEQGKGEADREIARGFSERLEKMKNESNNTPGN